MVIFHSYVSLPEGISPIGSMVLLYMVLHGSHILPSIYPSHVSINLPAPWILWVKLLTDSSSGGGREKTAKFRIIPLRSGGWNGPTDGRIWLYILLEYKFKHRHNRCGKNGRVDLGKMGVYTQFFPTAKVKYKSISGYRIYPTMSTFIIGKAVFRYFLFHPFSDGYMGFPMCESHYPACFLDDIYHMISKCPTFMLLLIAATLDCKSFD